MPQHEAQAVEVSRKPPPPSKTYHPGDDAQDYLVDKPAARVHPEGNRVLITQFVGEPVGNSRQAGCHGGWVL